MSKKETKYYTFCGRDYTENKTVNTINIQPRVHTDTAPHTHNAHLASGAIHMERMYETAYVDDTRYTSAPITLSCVYTLERILAFDCRTLDNSCTQAYCSRRCVLCRPTRQKHHPPTINDALAHSRMPATPHPTTINDSQLHPIGLTV